MASLSRKGSRFYVRIRDIDGREKTFPAGSDKREATRLMREIESRYARIRAGELDPDEASFAAASRVSIIDHIQSYSSHLEAEGRHPRHIHQVRSRLAWAVQTMGIDRLAGVTEERVQAALKRFRDRGLADQTVRHRIVTIKAFVRWAWRTRRLRTDPLARLKAPRVGETRQRGALSPEDCQRLILGAGRLPLRYGLAGQDRAALYAVAFATGLRRAELGSLTPESFHLDATPPVIVCRASFTKNGQEAAQPVARDVAEYLRPWLALKRPGEAVFNLGEYSRTSLMLRADMMDLGIEGGDQVDFHSTRRSYITRLALSDAPLRVVQALARHSDPKLTMNVYARVKLADTAAYVERAASILPAAAQAVEKTG